MSFRLITIDQLMQLDKNALAYALRLFKKELDGTLAFLAEQPEARADEIVLADLTNLLSLRKVFTLRLAELEAEAHPEAQRRQPLPANLVSEQYRQNELVPIS